MNDMIVLTRDNFDEVLTQIKHCDNTDNLPIIQINLIRPKMTLRFFYFLSIFASGIFGLLLSFINGEFDYLGLLFFWIFLCFFCDFFNF